VAGGQERVLRRRIKSVQSTKKITRAMELIAATRVAKAQQRAHEARPYSELLTDVIQHLAENGGITDHPLLQAATGEDGAGGAGAPGAAGGVGGRVRKVAFVVVSSDRGLAGGYNTAVIRAAEREIQARQAEGAEYALITVGRKAQGYFSYRSYDIAESFEGISDSPTYDDAVGIGEVITELYTSGEVQEVVLVFTRFVSMGQQDVVVRKFMPLTGVGEESASEERATSAYEFEPDPGPILESLLPRYVTARLFAALLDSAASEHASRQRAMKAATDNAEELIIKLTRVMNRARQDSITNEIMEIVGGAEALRTANADDPEELLIDHVFQPDPFDHPVPPHRIAHFPVGDAS
jgi:F-type H+-transporting ATPase subunit gamma